MASLPHVHEWEPLFDTPNIQPWTEASWRCECADILTFEEVGRRLNATERLNKSKAETAASLIRGHTVKEDLQAYAAALEGDHASSPPRA